VVSRGRHSARPRWASRALIVGRGAWRLPLLAAPVRPGQVGAWRSSPLAGRALPDGLMAASSPGAGVVNQSSAAPRKPSNVANW
jgi:hypothetical protein